MVHHSSVVSKDIEQSVQVRVHCVEGRCSKKQSQQTSDCSKGFSVSGGISMGRKSLRINEKAHKHTEHSLQGLFRKWR